MIKYFPDDYTPPELICGYCNECLGGRDYLSTACHMNAYGFVYNPSIYSIEEIMHV